MKVQLTKEKNDLEKNLRSENQKLIKKKAGLGLELTKEKDNLGVQLTKEKNDLEINLRSENQKLIKENDELKNHKFNLEAKIRDSENCKKTLEKESSDYLKKLNSEEEENKKLRENIQSLKKNSRRNN